MDPEPMHQFAWLFTRGDESVYMRVEEQTGAHHLTIYGPGSAQTSSDFYSQDAFTTFLTNFQQRLKEKGFQLHAKAERRSGEPRQRDDDRRRSEDGETLP